MKNTATRSLAMSLRLRERCMIWLVNFTQPIYQKWFRRNRPVWQQNITGLLAHDRKSLGYALGLFLQENQLALIPRFEDHDVFHVLLGYAPTVVEESKMQFCLLGSGKRSLYVLGTCAIAWLAFPEYWSVFRSALRRGKQLRPFHHWYFEYLLGEPITELRAFIQQDASKNQKIIF